MLITETILSDFMNFFVAVLASTFGWNPNDNLLEYLVWDQLDYTKLKNLEILEIWPENYSYSFYLLNQYLILVLIGRDKRDLVMKECNLWG